MKQPALALLCIGAFGLGCAAERGGKTSSDDRPYPVDAAPGIDRCAVEPQQLALTDTTQFGVDSATLLSDVLPLGTQPLFWVGYNVFPASYTPGESTSSVSFEISARDEEPVLQVSVPQGCFISTASVSVPVHVALNSADGALAEEFDSRLMFGSRNTARLGAFIPARDLAGQFAFTSGIDRELWDFKGLSLGTEVWPGGSRGHVAPEIFQRGSDVEPEPEARARTGYVDSLTPSIPSDWDLLAVWPRREACLGHVYDAQDRLAGWSLDQAAQEFSSRGAGRLLTADGSSTPIEFTLEPLAGLICAEEDLLYSPEARFRVRGRLKAQPGGTGSALDQLDANQTFQLTAHDAGDDQGIDAFQWDRIRSFIPTGETRQDFVLETHLEPATTDLDQLFLWSWQGKSTRDGAGGWSTTGKFLVQTAHEAEAKICQGQQQPPSGAPLPPPSCMSYPSASIDSTLISADLAP